jgi:hypothetical protein
MRRMSVALGFVAFLAVTPGYPSQAPDAHAQDGTSADATAAQFFRAALAAYDRHEYRAAALAFEEAYRRVPRSAAMYNAGRSWEAAGESARAADAFATALASGEFDEHDAQVARERLQDLEPLLGRLDIVGPTTATVSLDGVDRGSLPRKLHVAPGAHRIEVHRSDGSVVVRAVEAKAGELVAITVGDVPAQAPPPPPLPVPLPTPERTLMPTWGWVSLAATGVLGVAGAVTYVKFASDRSAFDTGGDHDASIHDNASAARTATYVLWGLGGACAVATGLALTLSPRRQSGASAEMRVGPGWASMTTRF